MASRSWWACSLLGISGAAIGCGGDALLLGPGAAASTDTGHGATASAGTGAAQEESGEDGAGESDGPPPEPITLTERCRLLPGPAAPYPERAASVATPLVGRLKAGTGPAQVVAVNYDEAEGCCVAPASIRVWDADCEGAGPTLVATLTEVDVSADSAPALGVLTPGAPPAIVAIQTAPVGSDAEPRPHGLVAFRRVADDASAWEVLWQNDTSPAWSQQALGGVSITLADLDGDGVVEVIAGSAVYDGATGDLKFGDDVRRTGVGDMGMNGFLGPISVAADLDLDGTTELAAGRTLYEADGDVAWRVTRPEGPSACGNLPCGGFAAVGNVDEDPQGELIVAARGLVQALEHDGQVAVSALVPPNDCAAEGEPLRNEGGPPTVADFDGDGRHEAAVASASRLTLYDFDCIAPGPVCLREHVRWEVGAADCASRTTGSSAFDFDGDGAAELVFADEASLRLLDGRSGTTLYENDEHRSNTRVEYPVVADVDGDGLAEILVSQNRGFHGDTGLRGVAVFAPDIAAPARAVWNQHAFAGAFVDDALRIAPQPPAPWIGPSGGLRVGGR